MIEVSCSQEIEQVNVSLHSLKLEIGSMWLALPRISCFVIDIAHTFIGFNN
jgi:hypothetical protein